MNRIPVSSSNLRSVGYDPVLHVLEVAFKNGRIYHYRGVPESIYTGLMGASSKGTYLDRNIKGSYGYNQVG